MRKWIVENFFQDIVVEHSNELNKCLSEDLKKTREELRKVQLPDNEKAINNLMGRRFTKEENERIRRIIDYGWSLE